MLTMNLIINIVFTIDTAREICDHLSRCFQEEFWIAEFVPGMFYIVHKTKTTAPDFTGACGWEGDFEIINETYRIADLIYERNEREKQERQNFRLLPSTTYSNNSPIIKLWEPDRDERQEIPAQNKF